MTRIRFRASPVWHETSMVESRSGRLLCVAETPAALLIRLKGTRKVVSLPWAIAYLRAADLAGRELLANRGKKRRTSVKRGAL